MNKKAIEVQFNWIFVLIVGAFILLFFITIIGRQKDVSEQKESITILDGLEQNIAGQKASTNRQDVINQRRPFDLEFFCEDTISISTAGTGAVRRLRGTVAFAPSSMQSTELLTLTRSWDMPFKISNFLYMTTPETKYYIIHASDITKSQDFIGELHDNMTIEPKQSAADIQYKGEQSVRLVFIDTDTIPLFSMTSTLRKADNVQVTAVTLPDVDDPAGTTATFYVKRGDEFIEEGTAALLGEAAMFGAIFSDSFENYACGMALAEQQFVRLTEVMAKRSDMLAQANPSCAAYHGSDLFEGVIDSVHNSVLDMTDQTGDPESLSKDVVTTIDALDNTNDQAVLSSCPRLY